MNRRAASPRRPFPWPVPAGIPVLAAILALAVSPATARQRFAAELRLRHADGREEVRRVDDLRFVYFERRFVRKSPGFGKPARLEIRDLPHEESFLQNEVLQKVKFLKIRRITFAGADGAGKAAHLVIERRKKKPPVTWPVLDLRNTSTSLAPHFRGRLDDRDVDYFLPPPAATEPVPDPVLVEINFDFPGKSAPRNRF